MPWNAKALGAAIAGVLSRTDPKASLPPDREGLVKRARAVADKMTHLVEVPALLRELALTIERTDPRCVDPAVCPFCPWCGKANHAGVACAVGGCPIGGDQ